MKKGAKTAAVIIATLIILLILRVYIGSFRPFSYSTEWKYEKKVIDTGIFNAQNPDIIKLKDGCYRMYTHGWKEKGENDIYSFYSCDGLNWQFEGLRIKQGGMPAAIMLDDGRIQIYFQRGINRNSKPEQALMTAVSDDGLSFVVYEKPLLETNIGELNGIKTMAHFEIVKLDNGYRIYFDEGNLKPTDFQRYNMTGWKWPVWRIRSIYSEDSFNWTLEQGVRIDYEQMPYMQRAGSCTVINLDGKWHMFFSAGFSPWEDWNFKPWARWEWGGVYEAVSDDGLNFRIMDKRQTNGGDAKAVIFGNKIRLYLSTNSWYSTSRIYRNLFGENYNFIFTKTKELK